MQPDRSRTATDGSIKAGRAWRNRKPFWLAIVLGLIACALLAGVVLRGVGI